MYPKQPVFSKGSASGNRKTKRDQIALLLINKFRNKLQINIAEESALDIRVAEHINNAVRTDQALGEKELVALSRSLT